MALLLAIAAGAAAQAPAHALALSPSAFQAFALEQQMDLQAIDAAQRQRRASNLRASPERSGKWTLYGRVGPMNFTNQLDAGSDGVQFSLRGNSFGLAGRIYIGVHRHF